MKKILLVTMAIAALAFTACDNGSTSGGGGPTGDPNTYTGYDSEGKQYQLAILKAASNPGSGTRDSRLVNAANDAWIDSYSVGNRDGFIFKADGTFQFIDDYTDTTPGVFAVFGAGTWSTSGNNSLTIRVSVSSVTYSETYSYTIAGTALTLTDEDGDSEVYTKTQVTVSGRSVVSPAPTGAPGNKSVTGAIKRAAGEAAAASLSSPANRAAAAGDKFTLTIKNASGTTVGESTGTIDTISSDASGDTYTLDHNGGKFTAKIKGLAIAEIPDPIPLDNGETLPAPGTLAPNNPNNPGSGDMTWTAVPANSPLATTANDIYAIAYGNGRWVAGGGSGSDVKMAYSDDGINWTAVPLVGTLDDHYINAINNISAIAYGNNTWVAVGDSGEMAYSSDGIAWTAVEDSTVWEYTDINAIAYGNNRFVAGGSDGKMAYSSDGINWTAVADSTIWDYTIDSTTDTFDINAIAYGGGRWVAGGGNKIAYSADGASWTAVTSSTMPSIAAIAYANGRFVAGGTRLYATGSVVYSSDGISWTAVSDSTFDSWNIYSIAYGSAGNAGNRFVAGGTNGKMAYSSDGTTWTAAADSTIWDYTYPTGQTITLPIAAIAYGNNTWVAVGSSGKMAYSGGSGISPRPASGPITWTAVAGSTYGDIYGITYGSAGNAGNRFVAGGGLTMIHSSDGASWTAVADSTFSTSSDCIIAIAYGNGKFVAVGQIGKIAYSSDGASWTAVANSTFGSDIIIRGIAYGSAGNAGGRFVAVGEDGTMAYSSDGVSWTAVADKTIWQYTYNNNLLHDINAIAYGDGKFVAGSTWGKMAYSTDGVNWTAAVTDSTSDFEIYDIAYGGGKFVAVGHGMAYSTDGVTWTTLAGSYSDSGNRIETSGLNGIAYGNNRFVVVGTPGRMAYSADGASWTTIWDSKYSGWIKGIAYGGGRFVAVCDNGITVYADW